MSNIKSAYTLSNLLQWKYHESLTWLMLFVIAAAITLSRLPYFLFRNRFLYSLSMQNYKYLGGRGVLCIRLTPARKNMHNLRIGIASHSKLSLNSTPVYTIVMSPLRKLSDSPINLLYWSYYMGLKSGVSKISTL